MAWRGKNGPHLDLCGGGGLLRFAQASRGDHMRRAEGLGGALQHTAKHAVAAVDGGGELESARAGPAPVAAPTAEKRS